MLKIKLKCLSTLSWLSSFFICKCNIRNDPKKQGAHMGPQNANSPPITAPTTPTIGPHV